jgi:hypothetical protein
MATVKTNAVTNPMAIVVQRAFGTVFSGSVHSSARWRDASRPANMKQGVARPVKKVTPAGYPVLLSIVAQTYSAFCFSERTRQVIVMIINEASVRSTDL